jgi:hypothetical protein
MSHRSRSSSRTYGSSSHAITAYGSNGAEKRERVWLGTSMSIANSTTRRPPHGVHSSVPMLKHYWRCSWVDELAGSGVLKKSTASAILFAIKA